jgi:hypothetical protein
MQGARGVVRRQPKRQARRRNLPRASLSLAVLSRETRSSPLIKRQLTALRTRAHIAAKNFKFSQTCGHLFQAGRPMRVYAVPAVIRLRLVITAITTPLRRVVGE